MIIRLFVFFPDLGTSDDSSLSDAVVLDDGKLRKKFLRKMLCYVVVMLCVIRNYIII